MRNASRTRKKTQQPENAQPHAKVPVRGRGVKLHVAYADTPPKQEPKKAAPRGKPFQPGNKFGRGRPKGPGIITRDLKESILIAYAKLGGARWLVKLAKKDAKAFAGLMSKLIPTQVTGADGGPLAQTLVNITASLQTMPDHELTLLHSLLDRLGVPALPATEAEADRLAALPKLPDLH